ncbi:hypothetical protein [Actinoallomurus sp. CA-150999]|uniref:hypothetical protein n=1 Tax=Actinoallomurus sp. CA-150999 TaxID=3239887 RepID=UPI003D914214
MALIVLAADKGAPGVTTAAVAIAAVWPRPVLLAECDQAGGDLVYRLPGEDGGMLNPARGMLSLAATARRGLRAEQIWEHTQRLVGGLDVLAGLTNAEQAQGLTWLWGPLGRAFADLTVPGFPGDVRDTAPPVNGGPPATTVPAPAVDVVADCGRLGAGSAMTDLLREASTIVLFTRATLEHVAHLRERINSLASELGGHAAPPIGVVVVADPREYRTSLTEVGRIISNAKLPASVLGGFALDPKGAEMLRGRWGGRLDRSLLIRSARQIAGGLAARAAGGPETGREGQGAASGSQSR